MKVKLFMLLCICLVLQSWNLAPVEKDNFLGHEWQAAIKESKKTKKPIFIYFAATRCGACRKMDKQTLQNKDVSGYYNENFINIRVDVDQIAGYMRAGKWDIRAVPTVVYLDQKRKMVQKYEGYQSPQQLISRGEAVVSQIMAHQ